MTSTPEVIQINYKPRRAFLAFHSRRQRYAVLVCHRRAGKTEAALAELVNRALRCKIPFADFAYIGPYAAQAKTVAWERLKRLCGSALLKHCTVKESACRIVLPNGCTINVFGADNYEAIRGLRFAGVVLDEVADMAREAWTLVIRLTLADLRGWAVFIGTPKGMTGLFYEQREKARLNPDVRFYMELKASESGLLSEDEIAEIKAELDEDEWMQELECSFEAAVKGSYYGKILVAMETLGQLDPLQPITLAPVQVVFDLGWSDATAAWFFQVVNGVLRVIDHQEWSEVDIHKIITDVKARNYKWGDFWLPHDAKPKSLQTGKSIVEQFWTHGIQPRPVPMLGVNDGIQAVRHTLPKMLIDGKRCYAGVEALKAYQKKWSSKLAVFSNTPKHDWASHSADAMRYLCLAVRDQDVQDSSPDRTDNALIGTDWVLGPTIDVNSIDIDAARSTISDEELQYLHDIAYPEEYARF